MIIYPAIDLLGGRCVRLQQGRYDKVNVYDEDPIKVAQSFEKGGAKWLHVVDLDAAKSGRPQNQDVIAKIVKTTGLKVQTGGGIRSMKTLADLIERTKVARCVLGTAAVCDPAFVKEALLTYGSAIAIGLDAKKGKIAIDGWTKSAEIDVFDFAKKMCDIGAGTLIYTDISRDGMLFGPAIETTRRVVELTQIDVIASGGIGSLDDVLAVKATGCAGVIIGKALYEGKVRLIECLQNA